MAKPLPDRFDPDLMPRDGTRLETSLPLAGFERLGAILASTEGEVHVGASFSRREDRTLASGRVRAAYPLRCQRCLEPMVLEVDEPFELTFVATEAEAEALDESLDPVVLDDAGRITAVAMLEDELILHVPLIARHPESVDCAPAETSFGGEGIEPEAGRSRPFDALKDLDLH